MFCRQSRWRYCEPAKRESEGRKGISWAKRRKEVDGIVFLSLGAKELPTPHNRQIPLGLTDTYRSNRHKLGWAKPIHWNLFQRIITLFPSIFVAMATRASLFPPSLWAYNPDCEQRHVHPDCSCVNYRLSNWKKKRRRRRRREWRRWIRSIDLFKWILSLSSWRFFIGVSAGQFWYPPFSVSRDHRLPAAAAAADSTSLSRLDALHSGPSLRHTHPLPVWISFSPPPFQLNK